jgi:hypothetical protein
MTKPTIFISYNHHDRDWAKDLAKALKREGVSVWLDADKLRPGDPRLDAIEQGLRKSDWIVFVLGPEESQPPNVLFEMGAAVGLGKRIVPVFPEDLETSRLPYPFRVRQGLIKESPEKTARKLIAAAGGEPRSEQS